MRILISIALLLVASMQSLLSQTASVTSGCAELEVAFSAPNDATYFWDFGDDSFSDLQNPIHSYIQPGDYEVTLYRNEGGDQVGNSIDITVYPEVEFSISADILQGCAPLEVNFQTVINAHPDLEITDIIWTFGDGSSGEGSTVNYTYNRPGTYSISLKVKTSNDIKCDNPQIFQDYIIVEGASTAFTVSKETICETPAQFFLINETTNDEGSSYLWDFGNSETSTEKDPLSSTYTEEGVYLVSLSTTTPVGCVTSFTKLLTVGSPVINVADTILCKAIENQIDNLTIADTYLWNFSNTDNIANTDITSASPLVNFPTSGVKNVTLTASSESGCSTTETITFVVEDLNSNFSYDPVLTCQDSFIYSMQAEDANMDSYNWTNEATSRDGINTSGPNIDLQYVHPIRDEYYFNEPDSIVTQLVVTSTAGCVDTTELSLAIQKAEAIFIPDTDEACVPYTITFEDKSYSGSEIENRRWDFGDNTTLDAGSKDTIIEHTYNTPGTYSVTLDIIDTDGCIDMSREVEILIKDIPIDTSAIGGVCPECVGESTDSNNPPPSYYCVGDIFQVNTPENSHIESIDGLFSTCWAGGEGNFIFTDPGPFSTAATFEVERVYVDSILFPVSLDILGSRSIIQYFGDCTSPYNYTFDGSSSKEADTFAWYINSTLISNAISFDHTFESTGDFKIYLETTRTEDAVCTPHRDSTIVHVRDIKAKMNIGDIFCDNITYNLDAANSKDAGGGANCLAKYMWSFDKQRSKSTVQDIVEHRFSPGNQNIILTAFDHNGCSHTVSKNINVYGITPEFELDSTLCLNSPVELNDLTISDTTIVAWDWQFGADSTDIQNPIYEFSEENFDQEYSGDTITINLILTDAIGCVDTISKTVSTYEIASEIILDNGPKICVEEVINFSAIDYTDNGSSLNFSWDFQDLGTIEEDEASITFPDSGEITATLTYTEESTGCTGTLDTLINVYNEPIADFINDKEELDVICFPEQITFTNTSTTDGPVLYIWDFGNGATSTLEGPVIPFDKGEWEVQLVVRSFYGCSDTIRRTIELVGPEGEFSIDKTFICPGEEITFTLENAVDINSFTWDLGNGVQIDDVNPLRYTYNPQSSITSFTPTLIIRTNDGGCEEVQALPIMISSLEGDFSFSTGLCPGEISFSSSFENAQNYYWDIGGQIIEGEANPSVNIMPEDDTFEVYLSVTDDNDCLIERRQVIDRPNLDGQTPRFPNVFSPNGDNVNPTFNPVYDPTTLDNEIIITTFRVYNRWGELLYDNENPSQGWNGVYKGEIVPADVYAYYIEIVIEGCESIVKKGNVTVIK